MLISITWWLGVIQTGPLAHFFNKHFLHFWKQVVTMSEEHSTRRSRLMCDNKNLRGVLAREPATAPRQVTWRKQSDISVSLRQNSMLKYPNCTRNIAWAHVTWG
jgi:hypothetical protein